MTELQVPHPKDRFCETFCKNNQNYVFRIQGRQNLVPKRQHESFCIKENLGGEIARRCSKTTCFDLVSKSIFLQTFTTTFLAGIWNIIFRKKYKTNPVVCPLPKKRILGRFEFLTLRNDAELTAEIVFPLGCDPPAREKRPKLSLFRFFSLFQYFCQNSSKIIEFVDSDITKTCALKFRTRSTKKHRKLIKKVRHIPNLRKSFEKECFRAKPSFGGTEHHSFALVTDSMATSLGPNVS